MIHELIHPNWHVVFVHYPLALLTTGIVIEILSFLWKQSTIRSAGRWMILLGALASLPAASTGIYGFVDAAKLASGKPGASWADLVSASRWQDAQWQFMRYHIWLTSAAAGLFLMVVVTWLGSSDKWRRKLYWPMLLALVLGLGGICAGAWYSGEAVYRHGVAVQAQAGVAASSAAVPATQDPTAAEQPDTIAAAIEAYADPMQTHLLLVGLMMAFAVGALGLTIRRWNVAPDAASRNAAMPTTNSTPEGEQPLPLSGESQQFVALEDSQPTATMPGISVEEQAPAPSQPTVYPARFWVLTSLLALLTSAAGLWYMEDSWQFSEIRGLLKQATSSMTAWQEMRTGQIRELVHFVLAISIVVLPLILALITRFSRGLKWITLIGVALFMAAVGLQVWYGILMLYHL